jgi:hypothetical protein
VSAAELDLVTLQRLTPDAAASQVNVLLGAGASAAAGLQPCETRALTPAELLPARSDTA